MKTEKLMTNDVKTCTTQDSLQEAAAIMWEHDCGCVPVVDDGGHLAGIITDRDVCMAAYTQGKALREIPVVGPMSKDLHTCRPADSVQAVATRMQQSKVRRLPVVDDENRIAGIISLNDLALEATRERTDGGKTRRTEVTDAELRETLAAVCEPASAAASS